MQCFSILHNKLQAVPPKMSSPYIHPFLFPWDNIQGRLLVNQTKSNQSGLSNCFRLYQGKEIKVTPAKKNLKESIFK